MPEQEGILILGEHDGVSLSTTTKEIIGVGKKLAGDLDQKLSIGLTGANLDQIGQEAIKYGAEKNKINVIRPAVRAELINMVISPKTQDSEKALKIISVGRCHWKKGYTFALDAMVLLKTKGIKFCYNIIAGGKDDEYLDYQIHDLDLHKHVTIIHGLSHEEVINRIAISDLFLLPSVEEGISNAVLESMALGIPVISTDCGGMAEVIKNGKNGFIVPVRESSLIATKIEAFISMKNEKLKIIKIAKETIKKQYLLEKQIDKMNQFYYEIHCLNK